jgi:hypothetical protein
MKLKYSTARKTVLSHRESRFYIKETAVAHKLLSLRLWFVSEEMSPKVFLSWCQSVHSRAAVSLFQVKNPTQPVDLSMSGWVFAQHFQGTGRGQEAVHTAEMEASGEIKNYSPDYGSQEMTESSGEMLPGISSIDLEFRGRRWRMCQSETLAQSKAVINVLIFHLKEFIPPRFPSKVTRQLAYGTLSPSI